MHVTNPGLGAAMRTRRGEPTIMPKKKKSISDRVGLPPGALVYTGQRKLEKPRITFIEYGGTFFEEREIDSIEDCLLPKSGPSVRWIDIVGIHEVQNVALLGQHFNIHPLLLEDVFNTEQRPKIEDLGSYVFLLIKHLVYEEESENTSIEQLSLVLGPDYVLSFQETDRSVFGPILERLRTESARIRSRGADFLIYALLDVVVDNYFVVLEKLGDRIESLEEELTENPDQALLRRIQHLRRDLTFVRRSTWPLREVIAALERRESDLVKDSTILYLRDVYDHTVQAIDTIETLRDTLTGMLDLYLSSVSYRLNSVMKVLTIIATVFMPLTFIAGVYGMNFKNMPELEWEWGYPFVLFAMLAIAVSMLGYFKAKKWI